MSDAAEDEDVIGNVNEDASGDNESDDDHSVEENDDDDDDDDDNDRESGVPVEKESRIKVDEAVDQDFLLLMQERQEEDYMRQKKKLPKRARIQKPLPPGLARLKEEDVIHFELEAEVIEENTGEDDDDEDEGGREPKDVAVSITVPEPVMYDKVTGHPLKYRNVQYVLERDLNLDQLRKLVIKNLGIRGAGSRTRIVARRAIALKKKIVETNDIKLKEKLAKLLGRKFKPGREEQVSKDSSNSKRRKDTPVRPRTQPRDSRVYPSATKLTDLPNLDDYEDFDELDEDDGIWPPRDVSRRNKRKDRGSWESAEEETTANNGLRRSISGERRASKPRYRRRSSGDSGDSDGSSVQSSQSMEEGKGRHSSVTFETSVGKESAKSRMEHHATALSKAVGWGMRPKFRKMIQAGEFSRALLQQAKSMEKLGMAPDVISGMRKQAANAMRESLGMPTAEALL